MRHYCTYFDRNFLLRGLALYRSLEAHAAPFTLWVLCLDDFTYDALARLRRGNLRPVRLSEFEDEALLEVKPARSRVEYYFTCSPSWPRYLLRRHPEIDLITYLDADLYFYASPEPIFEELGDNSILIVGHRFPAHLKHMEMHGIYNVGVVSFRNDEVGRAALEWWRERCLEWCYDRLEDGKFADQKYLDDWPARFGRVTVLQHKGVGIAPWNWSRYRIHWRGGRPYVDAQPMIVFHFHGLKIFNRWLCDPVSEGWLYGEMPLLLRWRLYFPYLQELKRARRLAPEATLGGANLRQQYPWRKTLRKILGARLILNYGLK